MNVLELTQRQRELLGNIVRAVDQYRQAVADASARLEHELEQIEQSRNKERQRIEEERKEKAKITSAKPPKNESQQKAREEREQRLQQEIAARRSTITLPTDITTIEAVKEEINRTLSTRFSAGDIGIIGKILSIIAIIVVIIFFFGSCAFWYGLLGAQSDDITAAGCIALWIGIVGFIILFVLNRPYVKREKAFVVNKIALLHNLYDRWLELVDEQASAQRKEAQKRYDQAVAQAKGQMLAAAEQSHLSIAEFSALTEQVSPSWESEAWRRWEPGSLGPGAVRLGVFTKTEV